MPTLLPIQPEQAFDLANFAKYLAYHDIDSLPARVSREKKIKTQALKPTPGAKKSLRNPDFEAFFHLRVNSYHILAVVKSIL